MDYGAQMKVGDNAGHIKLPDIGAGDSFSVLTDTRAVVQRYENAKEYEYD